ncbi:hypothetical protein FS837_010092 [Tulasnella sp. UAMH 9824]|nr:hypothetical protein FS837_010092 [Tulasnella sp. UAMH 9824]
MSQALSLLPELWPIVISFLANPSVTGEMPFSSRSYRSSKWTLQCTRAIRTTCLVSRFHYQIANPFRFAILSFVVSEMDLEQKIPTLKQLALLLDEQPHVLKWVQKLFMGKQPSIRPTGQLDDHAIRMQEYSALVSRLHSLFQRMSNLKALHLIYMPITLPIHVKILQSQTLKELHLEGISFPDPVSIPSVGEFKAEGLNLEVFKWASPMTGRAEEAAVALIARLQNVVEMQCWTRDGATVPSIIERRLPNQVFQSLHALIITVPPGDSAAEGFMHLGLRSPNLKSLQLHRSYEETPRQLADRLEARGIGTQHFSSIQIFKGPLPLAVVFGKGRPIREFWIDGEVSPYEPQDETSTVDDLALLESKADITYLYLGVPKWNENDFVIVGERFPLLETFTYFQSGGTNQSVLIDWPESRETSLRMLRHVKRLGLSILGVQIVDITSGPVPAGLKYSQAVENLSQSNPALEYFWISGLGSWTRGSGWSMMPE